MAGFAMTLKLAELIVKVDTVICKNPLSALGQAVGSKGLVFVYVLSVAE